MANSPSDIENHDGDVRGLHAKAGGKDLTWLYMATLLPPQHYARQALLPTHRTHAYAHPHTPHAHCTTPPSHLPPPPRPTLRVRDARRSRCIALPHHHSTRDAGHAVPCWRIRRAGCYRHGGRRISSSVVRMVMAGHAELGGVHVTWAVYHCGHDLRSLHIAWLLRAGGRDAAHEEAVSKTSVGRGLNRTRISDLTPLARASWRS